MDDDIRRAIGRLEAATLVLGTLRGWREREGVDLTDQEIEDGITTATELRVVARIDLLVLLGADPAATVLLQGPPPIRML